MVSISTPQHNLMEASAHGAKWAQKKVKPSVAKEFVEADKQTGKFRKKSPKKPKLNLRKGTIDYGKAS